MDHHRIRREPDLHARRPDPRHERQQDRGARRPQGPPVRISPNNSAASATRAAGAQLSASIYGVWKFLAKGSGSQASVPVQIYGLQLLPAGLSGRNQAAAGSVTKVAVRIYGPDTPSEILLKTVGVWTSDNDGATWRKVPVHETAGHYLFAVRNASAAGFTSVKVYVNDGRGDSEDLTVLHAYGVR